MPQFQVYADYGANYDLIARDIEETQQNIATWSEFDRAIETLSATVNPLRTREENNKKALSVKDLLIKVRRIERCNWVFRLTMWCTANTATPKIRATIQRSLQAHAGLR